MNGRAYKTMLYLGCVVGVYAGAAAAGERSLDESTFALVTIALLVPAFVAARLWFVVRHPHGRVFDRSDGGAGLFGGLVVGVVVSIPVLAVAGLPFWTFWDAAIITMLCGLILTRFGCAMNGCCCGRRTDSWLGLVLPNVLGERAKRYPTQLMESAFAAGLLVAALLVRNALPVGVLFGSVVVAYCAARTGFQRLREEPAASPAKSPVWGSSLVS